MSTYGWIGFDLDGTTASYDAWHGPTHIGAPIKPIIEKIREYIANGFEVRIFTARMSTPSAKEAGEVADAIGDWTEKHVGKRLRATCVKDYAMIRLYDDRAVQVEHNTGRIIG